jgi:hypothetical protein
VRMLTHIVRTKQRSRGGALLRALAVLAAVAWAPWPAVASDGASSPDATLRFVSARDHIEGSFVTPEAVFADDDRIYLASAQGLFVLARDRDADFPLLETIQLPIALTAVRGDRQNIYVTSRDGNLRVYRKTMPLTLVRTVPFGRPLSTVWVVGDRLYIGESNALGADRRHVYVNELNEGDVGLEVNKATFAPTRTYDGPFEPLSTVVFDRRTGERLSAIPNPPDLFGRNDPPRIYADDEILALTSQGGGVNLYDPRSFAPLLPSPIEPFANNVVRKGRWLIIGNESGLVDARDLRALPDLVGSTVNLPLLTGHTRIEDIEIRALWADRRDNLIFCGSSWGNDLTRGPTLPSFFVLELASG